MALTYYVLAQGEHLQMTRIVQAGSPCETEES